MRLTNILVNSDDADFTMAEIFLVNSQCDQIGRFIGLWAIYWTLGSFLKPLATIICPNLPHS